MPPQRGESGWIFRLASPRSSRAVDFLTKVQKSTALVDLAILAMSILVSTHAHVRQPGDQQQWAPDLAAAEVREQAARVDGHWVQAGPEDPVGLAARGSVLDGARQLTRGWTREQLAGPAIPAAPP